MIINRYNGKFGRELRSDDELVECAVRLQEMGAGNVLISMAGDGSILVTESGEIYREGVPSGIVRNSVGAGDSMVAGFIAGYLKSGDHRTALRLGAAAGSATAFSDDLATGDMINEIYEQMLIRKNA